jgi:hypothetical protein
VVGDGFDNILFANLFPTINYQGADMLSYRYPMRFKHPWLSLMFMIFPGLWPFWFLGVVRYWGECWCKWDCGFVPLSCPLPALWWPIKMYQRLKEERGMYGN